jgi:terminase small subunit-like protein
MSNANPEFAYEDDDDGVAVDEALANWERLNVEEDKERKRKNVIEQKAARLYTDLIAKEILERISAGELGIDICQDADMPTVRRLNQWLKSNPDFAALYKESINDRPDIFSEEIIQISDDAKHDFKEVTRNGRTVRVVDGDAIARAKLRVESRLKHLKAYRPQLWGEQTTLTTKNIDPVELMSDEELAKKIAGVDKDFATIGEDPRIYEPDLKTKVA